MPQYYFNLIHDGEVITDDEGTCLRDDTAAKEHAAQVARELILHNEARKRHWVVEVCNESGQKKIATIPLYTVDRALMQLPPEIRKIIERTSELWRQHLQVLASVQTAIRQSRATRARTRRKPYLITKDGELV